MDSYKSIFLGEDSHQTSAALWNTGKALGVNPDDKSGVGAPKVVRFCKYHHSNTYPATRLAPNRSSINKRSPYRSPLDFVSAVERGCNII